MINRTLILLIAIAIALSPAHAIANDIQEAIDPNVILEQADLKNGKSIYLEGKGLNSPHYSFTAGPHWLRSLGGSCVTCHGPNGLGNIEPDFCSGTTPPITYKFLAGKGYPFASRQSDHPAYTLKSLQQVLETGIKPNGYELDYCMPRWRLSDKGFIDLLGYLISLDNEK